jgi:GxxExxY protein
MLQDEGYRLMGAAFEVYNVLGYVMAEEIYQQSLEIELELRGIPFVTKRQLAVYYKDRQLQTWYCPDLLIYDQIVVELKAIAELSSDHEAQIFNYMRISGKQVGSLINFGKKGELQWKRLILNDLHSPQNQALLHSAKQNILVTISED